MTVLPSPTAQVTYESRLRTRYGLLAFGAGILVVVSLLIQEIGYRNSLTEETIQLLTIHKRFPLDIVGAVADGVGLLLAGAALWWLNSISLARDPKLSPMTRYLLILGAPLMSLLEIVTIVLYSIKANSFATGANLGYPAAYDLIHPISTVLTICSLAEELGAIFMAAGFIWTALNAMKVGLLPRPMGYGGVLAGALIIFAIGPISFVVQGAWLVCASVIMAGRWPNQPPAWAEGIAIPWLPGGRPNREAAPAPARTRGRGRGRNVVESTEILDDDVEVAPQQQTGDYTPRRKKKKR